MRQVFFILVALLPATAVSGVRLIGTKNVQPRESAALFVGIRDFDDKNVTPVPYAVDDAVDLAYELSIGQPQPLVPPERVVLALSPGEPHKQASRTRLKALLKAGAIRRPARQVDLLQLLQRQSRRVGRDGILLVALATHGVSSGGTQYLMATGSDVGHPPTMIADAAISDIVSKNDVPRSLILIDACRERLTRDNRTGRPDPRSVAAFLKMMTGFDGQVVIAGAPRGGYAYDDSEIHNGVFTAAIIEGLRCGAKKNRHGFITVDTLYDYVQKRVLKWVRENKNKQAKCATQLSCEGQANKMPLAICDIKRIAAAD
jgi:Caspase domain